MNTQLVYHSPDYLDDVRVTIVGIITEEDKIIKISLGASRCSKDNQFNKKDGRNRATERALDNSLKILELNLYKAHWDFDNILFLFRQLSFGLAKGIIADSRKVKQSLIIN